MEAFVTSAEAVEPARSSRFLPAVPEIAGQVLARIEADMPELATSMWRMRSEDEGFLAFELHRRLDLHELGLGYGPADLSRFGEYFAALARRGAPLPTVQRFLRGSVAHSFSELWTRAEPGDVTALLGLSRWLARHNGPVERLLVTTYCELLAPGRRRADDQEALAERLLAGLVDGSDVDPARAYLVIVLEQRIEPAPGLPAGAVSVTRGSRQHLLVPVEDGQRVAVWADLARWIRVRGGSLAAGAFAESPAAVPDAAAVGRRLLGAAGAVGLGPGLVGARDLVLESTIANRPQDLRELAATLDMLDAEPRLIETLSVFFGNDLDRTRTAKDLFLSRGGLTLRLERITVLTGLDPRSTRGIQVLGSAVSARALLALHEPATDPPASGVPIVAVPG